MPFITEALWIRIAPLTGVTGASIMTQPYPSPDPALENPAAMAELNWLKAIVSALRNIRGEMNIDPGDEFRCCCKARTRQMLLVSNNIAILLVNWPVQNR